MGFKSFFLLGFQFVMHFLRRPFRRRRGADRMLESFRDEGLRPFSPEERLLLPELQRCIHCGLCQAVCPLEEPSAQTGVGYNALAVSTWRDLSIRRVVATAARHMAQCGACGACEAVCPESIPLRQLARLVARD